MTIRTGQSGKFVASMRRGETLIEIMASIMVLAVGLVGVLAAIPFGGFRMSQMVEADNSAAVGRNAVRTIRSNGWANPNSWLVRDSNYGNPLNSTILDWLGSDYLNCTIPFVLDYHGSELDADGSAKLTPYLIQFSPTVGGTLTTVNMIHVSPLPLSDNGYGFTPNLLQSNADEWYEHIFYQQDDLISGYYADEDETEFRPRIEDEPKNFLNPYIGSTTTDSFTGRYSWMAFIYPRSGEVAYADKCKFSDVDSANYEAVVFCDRIVGEEKAFTAYVEDSGYQGGSVVIDLSSCPDCDHERVREQLSQTRFIMLNGQDSDYPLASSTSVNGVYPRFAHWYKIANFANVDDDTIRLTLIGENTPVCWAGKAKPITALFYPGAVGVFCGSTTSNTFWSPSY